MAPKIHRIGNYSFEIEFDLGSKARITGFDMKTIPNTVIGVATISNNQIAVNLSDPYLITIADNNLYMKFLRVARAQFPNVRPIGSLEAYIMRRSEAEQQQYQAELAAAPAQWQAAMDAQQPDMNRAPDPNQTVLGKHPIENAEVPYPKRPETESDPAPN